MESGFRKSTIIIATAIVTFIITNTVRDILYVRNNGALNNKVSSIAKIIDNYGLYDVDKEKMADYAASGMVLSLEDQYTNYYTKEEFKSYQNNLSNSFYGVGIIISVDVETNKLLVIESIEGAPASNAGILSGDYIVAVDGVEYSGEQMSHAVSLIRGDELKEKKGTTVVITVERDGVRSDYTVTREIVENDSVSEKMISDNIGYIRITAFNSANPESEESKSTYDEFVEAVKTLKDSGMRKLIIDLRDNPGGNLSVVNDIADELLPEGLITYTESKDGQKLEYASEPGELDMPMAVLVNGSSASAAELLTGALKDYDKAEIIGTNTFGKGIVQTLFPLGDESGISVTTSKYYTPNGVCIHGVGIAPDIVVEMEDSRPVSAIPENEDIQLQKAIEVIRDK